MRFKLVASGHQPRQITRTCVDIGDLVAAAALEVMMVVLVNLIAIRFARQRDHIHDTVSDQAFDIAVNRGQAKVGDCLLSFGQ